MAQIFKGQRTMTTPTKEQIRKIADGIYCCLPDDDLLQVVEHSIREWEKIRRKL